MKCTKCGISVFKAPLKRTGEKGKDPKWMCDMCMQKHEPELYKNEMADESDVERQLKKDFYRFK